MSDDWGCDGVADCVTHIIISQCLFQQRSLMHDSTLHVKLESNMQWFDLGY